MKTTFSMILERACSLLSVKPVFVSAPLDQPVSSISLWQSNTALSEETLYISAYMPLPQERPRQIIVLSGEGDPSHSGNLAVLPSSVSRSLLLAVVQGALSYFNQWGDHILEMIYTNQGLDAIVNFAYETFKNPILIYDSSLKVLAYTKNDGSSDRMWRDTVQHGSVNSMSADEAREFMAYVTKLNNSAKPFKHTAKDLTDPFYNGNVLLAGQRVGMVDLMERNHPVTQGELDLLEAFCYLLSFELQKDSIRRENRGLIYHQLILDLLDGSIKDTSALHSRLNATHWKTSPYTRVVTFQPENDFMAEPEMRRAFDHLLALSVGRGILREREIILLISCQDDHWTGDMQHMLRTFCTAHQLRCGVSDAYQNLLDTSLIAPQSSLALTLSEDTVVLFDSVRFENLLNLCRTQPYPAEFLHPAILQLSSYDAEHNTDYLATLEALLNCQHNQMLASRDLHIHRTTLIYRLQRICEMTGLHLQDATEMLYVHFSLCVFRSAQKQG